MALNGYPQSKHPPGLGTHGTQKIQFCLVVDDFGIKYVSRDNAEHLKQVLEQYYAITTDWGGTKYVGLTIDWQYKTKQVHISMPGYIAKALKRFNHKAPKKMQHQPHPHIPPQYGKQIEYAPIADTGPRLNKKQRKFIQEVTRTFFYYSRAVNRPMLITLTLSDLMTKQANPTATTMQKTKQVLDYAASNSNATLTYNASNMMFAVHGDASYLNEKQA